MKLRREKSQKCISRKEGRVFQRSVFSDSENFINFIKAEVASNPLTLQRRL